MRIGVDIGGSFTKAGLVKDGKIIKRIQVPTRKGSLDSVFQVIDELIQDKVSGIGIGIAGMVANQRVLLSATNLGLAKLDVAGIVEKKYNVPVRVANDVACFALAEGLDNIVYLAIGTGVNVGVVTSGKLLEGIEYGHTHLMVGEKTCSCGLSGCVEQFVSGKALVPNSKELPKEFLANLVIVLVNIANTYRPQKIFIGGGLANMVTPHVKWLNSELRRKDYGYKNAPAVTVEISRLSADGGILGASYLLHNGEG